jgi:hypothetical protein
LIDSEVSLLDACGPGALDFHWLFVEWAWWLLAFLSFQVEKLLANLFLVEARMVQPGVTLELLDSVSVFAFVAEQLEDHVLEVCWETSSIHFFEVGFDLTGQKEVVEVLFLASFLEGEDTLHDDKYDDSHAEQVNLSSIVCFSFFNFRGHIRHCASVRLEVIDAFVASKTEIGNFQVQLIVNENVLELKITMHAAEVVHVVEGVDHLGHEEAASIFSHGTHGLAQVEEETSLDILHHDEDQVADDATWWFDYLASISEITHSDNSTMLEVLEDSDFVLDW